MADAADLVPGVDGVVGVVLAVVALVLVIPLIVVLALVFAELLLLLLLLPLFVLLRLASRRPWIVQVRGPRKFRRELAVRGFASSGAAVRQIAEQLRAGRPIDWPDQPAGG